MIKMKSLKKEWRKEMAKSEEKVSLRTWIRSKGLKEKVSEKIDLILGNTREKPKKKTWVTGKTRHGVKPTPTKKKK